MGKRTTGRLEVSSRRKMHEASEPGRTMMVNGVVVGITAVRSILQRIADPPLEALHGLLGEEEALLKFMVSEMGQHIGEQLMSQARSGFGPILSLRADVGKCQTGQPASKDLWFTVGELDPSYEGLCRQLDNVYRTLARTQDELAWLRLPFWRRWEARLRNRYSLWTMRRQRAP